MPIGVTIIDEDDDFAKVVAEGEAADALGLAAIPEKGARVSEKDSVPEMGIGASRDDADDVSSWSTADGADLSGSGSVSEDLRTREEPSVSDPLASLDDIPPMPFMQKVIIALCAVAAVAVLTYLILRWFIL